MLTIDFGNVSVHEDVLYVELFGKYGDRSYSFTFPFGIVEPRLKMKKGEHPAPEANQPRKTGDI